VKVHRGFGLLVVALTLAMPAQAQDEDAATRSAARHVALEGIAALQQGDATLATEKLEKAYRVLKVPSIALWSARALVKHGQLVEASERYLAAGRLSFKGGEQVVQEQAKNDAEKELAELTPRIPSVVVVIEGAKLSEVTVSLDGKAVPRALLDEDRPLNPGQHELVGQRGEERPRQVITVAEGEKKRVVLQFASPNPPPVAATGNLQPPASAAVASPAANVEPAANSAPTGSVTAEHAGGSAQKSWAIATLVGGGVGLVVGGVTGLLALSKRSDLDHNPNCKDGQCLAAAQGDVDSFRAMRTASTVGFIAGGVLSATGVVLLLTSHPHSSERAAAVNVQLSLHVAPGALRLAGTF
jgi:hypothetical protein